jgi:hypothetical protein
MAISVTRFTAGDRHVARTMAQSSVDQFWLNKFIDSFS